MRRLALLALVFAIACTDDAVAPSLTTHVARVAAQPDVGPPPPREFGPDSYQTGLFTGTGTALPGLHCDDGSSAVRNCSGYLASSVDGTLLDATLQIPTSATPPVPLVVMIHGYAGSKTSSGNLVQPLIDDGYAVLRYSTRGFGNSWGQVNLVDVHAEVADLRSMIAQVVDVDDYGLNPDAVAVTGASYGGGHSWLAALEPTFATPANKAVRIRTVVPIAAWSDLLQALLPNGREDLSVDHPGGAKLSYINGLYASGLDPLHNGAYPNYPPYFIAWHGWIDAQEPNESDPLFRQIEDGLAGYRSIWWQRRFWSDAATPARVPVFMVQGFTDDLFPLPEAKRMLLALQTIDPAYPVTAYFGDIGHPRASNKPGEIDYVLGLIERWLGYYLKGVGAPPAGVYAALTRPRSEPFDAANVISVPTLGALSTSTVTKRFPGAATLVNPLTDPVSGFFWDPLVMEGAEQLEPLPAPPESPTVPGSLATYIVPVADLSGGGALTIAGQPLVSLHVATAAYRVQLDARLFDVDAGGTKQLVTRGTYTIDSGSPTTPIDVTTITIPLYGNYWRAETGHTLRLELTNVDSPYIAPSRVPSVTTVNQVQLSIPVR
ncbi:MAG: alpha/beta fold hydrolase [Gemmatimonadaceae bacterium]|nr:alpha/beta fold hydrolase [Gemmatimonadaceae bacterium]NUQ91400.1 alpha/beta fold hydrolase [Gemmatimonadaceae bacterium]NUR20056.1 alpha/beta fold hydrolase [Gemmatimonadaceae bacterium]NUS98328.1 alpha/beta fold hydrolase [Gemmatimonadaceae bacterium]